MSLSVLLPALVVTGVIALGILPALLRHWLEWRRLAQLTLVLALGVGVVGAGLYLFSDNRELAQRIALQESDPQAAMGELAEDMRERLHAEGEAGDPRNYYLLGRALSASGDWDGAVTAFAEANRRAESADPDLLVAEAEARLNHPERDQASFETAERRVEQALALAPRHPGANFFAGALAIGAGNETAALPHLRVVLQSDLLQGRARERLAERVETIAAQQDAAPGEPDRQTGAEAPAVFRVTVQPAPGNTPEGGTLFVFLRRPDGPPMPLAARRIDAPQWPVTVRIGDAHRLAGGPSLGSHDSLEVAARWSAQGDALSDRDGPQASKLIDPSQRSDITLQLAAPVTD